jgi:hypothetical protein
VRLQQAIDIGGPRRLKLSCPLGQRRLIACQPLPLLLKHRFCAQRLRQIGPALIALGDPQSKQRL